MLCDYVYLHQILAQILKSVPQLVALTVQQILLLQHACTLVSRNAFHL